MYGGNRCALWDKNYYMEPVEWILLGGSSLFLWFWISCDTEHFSLEEEKSDNKDFLTEFENF